MGPDQLAVLANAYAFCRGELKRQGYSVGILTDFTQISPLLEASGKTVTPFFQSRFFDFNGDNGFCHLASENGHPISFYCSQVFDTGRQTYLEYHRTQLERIYGPEHQVDGSWDCRGMEAIRGRVIYSGDAMTVPGSRSVKGSLQRLQLLAKMNLYLGLSTWHDVTASVGLARAKDVSRGLGAHYGAYHIYPQATRWIDPPADRKQDDMFLFSWADDILYQARLDVAENDAVPEASN